MAVLGAPAGILEFDDPATVAAKLAETMAAAVEEPAERQWLEARLAPLRGLPGERGAGAAEQEETFAAWRRFLEALAAGELGAALGLIEELEEATRDGPGCYRADPLPIVARICRRAARNLLAETGR